MTSPEKIEIKRLKRKLRQWQRLYSWERMESNYSKTVAQCNLGDKPSIPKYE